MGTRTNLFSPRRPSKAVIIPPLNVVIPRVGDGDKEYLLYGTE
jgi:hypothetical protein